MAVLYSTFKIVFGV